MANCLPLRLEKSKKLLEDTNIRLTMQAKVNGTHVVQGEDRTDPRLLRRRRMQLYSNALPGAWTHGDCALIVSLIPIKLKASCS